jgi:hypothetical protein
MLSRGILFASAVFALALWATPSRAVPLSFVLTGADSASWLLDSNPAPDGVFAGFGFRLTGPDLPAHFLFFWSSSLSGGLTASDDLFASGPNILDLTGPVLYSGSEDAPAFLTGIFKLTGLSDADHVDTLTISATPLPAAWILFLTALAGLFGWRRSRMSPA